MITWMKAFQAQDLTMRRKVSLRFVSSNLDHARLRAVGSGLRAGFGLSPTHPEVELGNHFRTMRNTHDGNATATRRRGMRLMGVQPTF